MQEFADAIHDRIAFVTIRDEDDYPFRGHLGASVIGHSCDRYLWYHFRWVKMPSHSARLLRIFRRGRTEEERIINMLRSTGLVISSTVIELCENMGLPPEPRSIDIMRSYGLDVYTPNTVEPHSEQQQIKVNLPPHLGGSLDGILHVPENYVGMFGYFMPIEIKTHNKNSFSAMKKNGDSIRWNVPQHFVQGNTYAVKTGCSHFLYVAENKNDDELYLKQEVAESSVTALNVVRAEQIIYQEHEKHTAKTTEKWRCRMCDFAATCHRKKNDAIDIARNCRTCVFSRPLNDGSWTCSAYFDNIEYKTEISRAAQCPQYEVLIK